MCETFNSEDIEVTQTGHKVLYGISQDNTDSDGELPAEANIRSIGADPVLMAKTAKLMNDDLNKEQPPKEPPYRLHQIEIKIVKDIPLE